MKWFGFGFSFVRKDAGSVVGGGVDFFVGRGTTMEYDYDLIVIGGGSGGVRAARISAGYGAKVAVFEGKKWGGTCVNVGCVPKKLFVYGSRYSHTVEQAEGFGWDFAEPKFSWKKLIENKNKVRVSRRGIHGGKAEGRGLKGRNDLKSAERGGLACESVAVDRRSRG